jgi:MoxR-like ATPase
MVIATQNPFEYEGTYTLPESQLDRFLVRISMGYPSRAEERRVLSTHRQGEPVQHLDSVLTTDAVVRLQEAVREVTVEDSIYDYLLDVVDATRKCEELHVGVSTRGALSLYRASQALALCAGRTYVVPDDIKQLAVPALAHRVIPKGYMHGSQRQAVEAVIRRLVDATPVPS